MSERSSRHSKRAGQGTGREGVRHLVSNVREDGGDKEELKLDPLSKTHVVSKKANEAGKLPLMRSHMEWAVSNSIPLCETMSVKEFILHQTEDIVVEVGMTPCLNGKEPAPSQRHGCASV